MLQNAMQCLKWPCKCSDETGISGVSTLWPLFLVELVRRRQHIQATALTKEAERIC